MLCFIALNVAWLSFFLGHHPDIPRTEICMCLHGLERKVTKKILKFLVCYEWESTKERFYHGLGAMLFICSKNEKSDGLTVLIDIKIKAVSSSLCWSRLNQMGPCSNHQTVCSHKVTMLGLKERKVKEEKILL